MIVGIIRSDDVYVGDAGDVKIGDVGSVKIGDVIGDVGDVIVGDVIADVIADVIGDVIQSGPRLPSKYSFILLSCILVYSYASHYHGA